MKKLLLLLLAVLSFQFAKAAHDGITLKSSIDCDMMVVLYAKDNTNPFCQYYISSAISVPAGTGTNYTWAQLTSMGVTWLVTGTGVPATPDFTTITIDHFRVDYSPSTGCSGNSAIVGTCTPWSTTNTLPAGCSCNGGNPANIRYIDDGSYYILKILP